MKALKAAQQRHLVPVILQLVEEYDDGSPFRKMRTLCLKHLNEFYKQIDACDMYLTQSEHTKLMDSVERCLVFYGSLASQSAEQKKFKWSTVNKHHFMFHLGQQAKYVNPRWLWCYMAEDLMRHLVKVCAALMIGSGALLLDKKLCQRWRIGRYRTCFATTALDTTRVRNEGLVGGWGGGRKSEEGPGPRQGEADFEITRQSTD